MHQKPSAETYNPPHINIDGTLLNTVGHFSYPGSVISNDATVAKDVDNRLAKASSSFQLFAQAHLEKPFTAPLNKF